MITYEVNLIVHRSVEAEFRAWLDDHVREILSLPGFTGAQVFERLEPASDASEFALCTQYRLRDEAALERYLREFAPALRADGLTRFGDRFRAERRVLRKLADY